MEKTECVASNQNMIFVLLSTLKQLHWLSELFFCFYKFFTLVVMVVALVMEKVYKSIHINVEGPARLT